MIKKLVFLFIGFGLVFGGASAEETYTISGEVNFKYDADLYICLYTKEGWRDYLTPGYDFSSSQCRHIEMNPDLKKEGKISFRFESVPKGTYVIIAYQDTNGNGKVDFENYAISEPRASYKKVDPLASSIWDSMKFDLDKDITGVEIQM